MEEQFSSPVSEMLMEESPGRPVSPQEDDSKIYVPTFNLSQQMDSKVLVIHVKHSYVISLLHSVD